MEVEMIDNFKNEQVKIRTTYDKILEGIVVGFSKEKGITIVSKHDGRILLCAPYLTEEEYKLYKKLVKCQYFDITELCKKLKTKSLRLIKSQYELKALCRWV